MAEVKHGIFATPRVQRDIDASLQAVAPTPCDDALPGLMMTPTTPDRTWGSHHSTGLSTPRISLNPLISPYRPSSMAAPYSPGFMAFKHSALATPSPMNLHPPMYGGGSMHYSPMGMPYFEWNRSPSQQNPSLSASSSSSQPFATPIPNSVPFATPIPNSVPFATPIPNSSASAVPTPQTISTPHLMQLLQGSEERFPTMSPMDRPVFSLEDEDPLGPPPDFSSMIDSTQDGEMMNLNHMSPSAKRMKTDYGSIPVHSMQQLNDSGARAGRVRVRKKCNDDTGCANLATKNGKCDRHGGHRKRCAEPTCTKQSIGGGRCLRHGGKKKVCEYEGCAKLRARGKLCYRHNSLRTAPCRVTSCQQMSMRDGLCKQHCAEKKPCIEPNCQGLAYRRGKCSRHYVKKSLCAIEGCPSLVYSKGKCGKHGGRAVCITGGCTTQSRTGSQFCFKHNGAACTCSVQGCSKRVKSGYKMCYAHSS